jgi:site-specific recombinase XerD
VSSPGILISKGEDMTDQFFSHPKTLQSLHEGPLGAHIDAYAALLHEQGYGRQGACRQIRLVGDLNRWLERRGLDAKDVNSQTVETYLRHRRRHLRPHPSDSSAPQKLLRLLRERGILVEEPTPLARGVRQCVEEDFARYLSQERGLSLATVVYYRSFTRQFLLDRFGTDRIRFTRLGAADITNFVLRHARDFSPGRAKLMVTALRSFLRYLWQRGETASDLAACVPGVPCWSFSTLPKFLPPGQVRRVLDHCDRRTATGRRDYAILLLLARLGLRAGEVVTLTLDDIDGEGGRLTFRSKGGRWAELPLPADVGEALASYLQQGRPRCASRRVFIRQCPPRVGFANSVAICTIVKDALARAGVNSPRKGAHLFRHSLATGMLRQGASLAQIGELLRHQHPNTTTIYAKVDLPALRSLALPWPGGGR